ncbi:hypothetical protein M231_07426 [Tremella mesenterica]|uniref:Uncharacterized protein n=1 Tax=Tremella mesenterica TaxID=5217 RepID=A0A4Q1BFT4_TREME|nr:hypothetical protein M231_07426 [Tremella mesenterica]
MDLLSTLFDVLFLLGAIYFFPRNLPNTPAPIQIIPSPLPSAHSSLPSPLPSPRPMATLEVPKITFSQEGLKKREKRKSKSVSFSISSLDEIINDGEKNKGKRPPTPWVRGPVSPSAREESVPGTPLTPLSHSYEAVDPMGVKKGWLMPR